MRPMDCLCSNSISAMMQRALNLVDPRLIDHGIRVALAFNAMLELEGGYGPQLRQKLCIVALLHDVGAYRTEEIDKLVAFETDSVWQHAIYGYLFLRELSPLGRWSQIVLYHHMPFRQKEAAAADILHLAQLLHVADRADVFLINQGARPGSLQEHLRARRGSLFAPRAVGLFEAAEARFHLSARMRGGVALCDVCEPSAIPRDEALIYLRLLVHAIDFRSHHTVTHTVNTTQIGWELARRMGLPEEDLQRIYTGALLHDLGKIGIPVEILEKPGKLTPAEMTVMRTHVDLTEKILGGSVAEDIARIALRHHEKLDGSGYPRGLPGPELTLPERIVAVSDIVSALAGTRSYKEPFPKERILSILQEMRVREQLDPDAVLCMAREFDGIMAETARYYAPAMEAYQRIKADYPRLLARLDRP